MKNHDKLEAIAQKAAAKVAPTIQQAKAERKFADKIVGKLSKAMPKAKLQLVGSTARDTGLAGDNDIDVFAAFPRNMEEKEIVEITVSAVKKAVPAKWEMHYAEHPYLQAVVDGYSVEVIPCFLLETGQPLKSAVDRTPLHMDYLQKRLTQEQRADVRALKKLLKTHGLYGAEQKIRGFSGLLCEYLILNYRSLAGLAENARMWRPPVRIEIEKSLVKFDAPLTFIDAVDPNRNVAAVVSNTQLHRFIALMQKLWAEPSESLFFNKKEKPATTRQVETLLRQRETEWLMLKLQKPDVVEDIFWPQLERTTLNMKKQLTIKDFGVTDSAHFEDEKNAYIFLAFAQANLPATKKVFGPPVTNEAATRQFLKGKKRAAVRGPYVEEDRSVIEERRETRQAVQLVKQTIAHPERFGVASHLLKPMKKAKLITVKQLSPSAIQQLCAHLQRKESWW